MIDEEIKEWILSLNGNKPISDNFLFYVKNLINEFVSSNDHKWISAIEKNSDVNFNYFKCKICGVSGRQNYLADNYIEPVDKLTCNQIMIKNILL